MHVLINKENRFNPAAIRESVASRFGEEAFLARISKAYEEVIGRI
jgi:hypothetical protein